ncbi:hypothetical protein Q6241_33175, partial [Klebsiella pneumoniae]
FLFLGVRLCDLWLVLGDFRVGRRLFVGKGRLVVVFGRLLVATSGMGAMQGRSALVLIAPPCEKYQQQGHYRNSPFFQ